MKQLMVLLAALPFAVAAADNEIKIDASKLRAAIPASALIDQEVMAAEREAAELEDIVVSRDGKVRFFLLEAENESVLVDAEPVLDDTEAVLAEETLDDEAAAIEEDVYEDATEPVAMPDASGWGDRDDLAGRGFEVDDEMRAVQPRDISFSNDAGNISLAENAELYAVAEDEDRIEGMRITEIIGMEVNLADDDSFGRVEDVMLNREGSEVVAVVVDNWDGLNKERRALPFDDAIVLYEEEEITFPWTEDQVEAVPEFNLDAYDDGWF